jgi:hypothetical protein
MKAIFKNGFVGVLLLFLFAFAVWGQNNFGQNPPDTSNDSQSVSLCIFAPANVVFLSDTFGKRRDSKHDVQYDWIFSFNSESFADNFFRHYSQNTILTGNFTTTPIPPSAPRASPACRKIL